MLGKTPETLLTSNALTVLGRQVSQERRTGQVVEPPEELFRRVAGNIAQTEYCGLNVTNVVSLTGSPGGK